MSGGVPEDGETRQPPCVGLCYTLRLLKLVEQQNKQKVYCTVLCVLYCTVLLSTLLCCAVLCCALLYSSLLFSTLLYCIVLYCTQCTVHCTVGQQNIAQQEGKHQTDGIKGAHTAVVRRQIF